MILYKDKAPGERLQIRKKIQKKKSGRSLMTIPFTLSSFPKAFEYFTDEKPAHQQYHQNLQAQNQIKYSHRK